MNIIIKNNKIIEILENAIVAVRSIASAIILIDGGAPRFLAFKTNHQIVREGNKFIIPLTIIKLRVWDVSYVMFAIEKRADEIRPWAIISKRALVQPHEFNDKIPAVTRPICLTDEYAIKAFISVWRRHKVLAIHAPQILKIKIGVDKWYDIKKKFEYSRNNPYLPSLRRIPARIIEPETGASTWALGSHKWRE